MDIDTLSELFYSSPVMLFSAWLALFNLSITLVEVVVDLGRGQRRRWKDSGANAVLLFMNALAERTWYGAIMFVLLLPFYYFVAPFELPMTVWTWLAALLVADFTYYWMHRIEHQIRILWAHHSVHHSSEDFNLTVSFRLCLFESVTNWVFFIPMILIGFNPFQTIVALLLVAQYQHWIHTEYIPKLGWLEGIINTPSSHRVHHGSNQKYLDRNFGGVLMIWDRLFGTYSEETDRVTYGLTTNIETNNPFLITIHEYLNILRDFWSSANFNDRVQSLFGGVGARPQDNKEQHS